MNENSRGNSNMNPEQARLAALHQERERLTWEQHKREQEPVPAIIKERQKAYRAEQLRLFLARNYPNETKREQEAHLRQLLGEPEPVKKAAAPIRKPATLQPVPARVKALANNVNKRIAKHYGIKDPGEVQYR